MTTFQIGDVVYYESFPGAGKERGIVTSFCDNENFIFVRFKGPNGERTPVDKLSL